MKRSLILLMVMVVAVLVIGCADRLGIGTGDKAEVNINVNNVITDIGSDGDTIALLVKDNAGNWIEVDRASPDLLMRRNVSDIDGDGEFEVLQPTS